MSASAQLSVYRAARASELVRAEIERHIDDLPADIARRLLGLATIARDETRTLEAHPLETRAPVRLPVSQLGALGATKGATSNVVAFPRRLGAPA